MTVDTRVQLASRIRTARLLKGLSMRELAATAGISVGFLSNIESCKANASLATISNLCLALGITVSDLFAEKPLDLGPERDSERELLTASGGIAKSALLHANGNHVAQYQVDIEPGGSTGGDNRHDGCTELVYVVKNAITVRLDQSTTILDEGDSLRFPSEVEHEFTNHSAEPARIHWTIIRQRGQQ